MNEDEIGKLVIDASMKVHTSQSFAATDAKDAKEKHERK